MQRDGWRERVGELVGASWAPLIHTIAKARRARFFHPDGQLFVGAVTEILDSPFTELVSAMGSNVLARFSGALRREGNESLDVLGIALRFSHAPIDSVTAGERDQDLLFASILSPFTMGLSPFTTHSHDFFANRYYAVSPFALEDGRRVKFRLSPLAHPGHHGTRTESLRAAVEGKAAHFVLEARETLRLRWAPIAHIVVEHETALDQKALRFSAFQDGAGIIPVGVIQAIRRRAYPASQSAR